MVFLTSQKEKTMAQQILASLDGLPLVVQQKFSTEHWAKMRRMSCFLAATDPVTAFQTAVSEMDWAASTADSYWATMRTVMKLLNIAEGPEIAALQRLLKDEVSRQPTWDAEDGEELLDDRTVGSIMSLAESAVTQKVVNPSLPTAVALIWGQRIGDVLKLKGENIWIVKDSVTPEGRIGCVFVETKTARASGPYTLSASLDTLVGRILRMMKGIIPNDYIFLCSHSEIHQWLPQKLCLRALRRTGLVRLALTGITLAELMSFSRHKTVGVLEVYLFRGIFNIPVVRAQLAATKLAENMHMPRLEDW